MAFTFFFRDEQILALAAEKLVPLSMGRRFTHILNAGCAMGMETYTFAILLSERMGKFAMRNVRIHAIDIDNENANFGQTVKDGCYHKDHLQRIPPELFDKYFITNGKPDYFQVHESLRSLVEFQKHDLLSLTKLRDDYSLVICKNVLLHFNYEQRIEVLKLYHEMLLPGGLLVMENTQAMPPEISHLFNKLVNYTQLYEKI